MPNQFLQIKLNCMRFQTKCGKSLPGRDSIDIYPTLLELCRLPPYWKNEGTSLVPLLELPERAWGVASVTTHRKDRHAVRLRNWRYIRYDDGSEELYDLENDPNEWTNLAVLPGYEIIKMELKYHLPAFNAEPIPAK